jgi:hypothetical protein
MSKLSTGLFKRMQKRYFVISTHYMKYYEVGAMLFVFISGGVAWRSKINILMYLD